MLDGLRRDVEVEALSSRDVLTYRVDSRDPYDTFLYADLYDEQGRFLMRQVELLVPAKHFQWRKPTFDVRIAPVPGGAEISVQADVFAKGVFWTSGTLTAFCPTTSSLSPPPRPTA